MTGNSTLAINTIGVNPEAKWHVRIVQEVNNGTTTDAGVLIGMTRIEQDTHNTCERVGCDVLNAIGVADNNGEEIVEHR